MGSTAGNSSEGTPFAQKSGDTSNTNNTSNFYMSQMGQGGHNDGTMISNMSTSTK